MLPLLLLASALVGSCQQAAESPSVPLIRKHDQLVRAGQTAAAAELTLQLLRDNCVNPIWWRTLADELATLKRWPELVDLLNDAQANHVSALETQLFESESKTAVVLATPEYRDSAIRRIIDQHRFAFDERHRVAKQRLRTEPHPPEHYIARHACPFECCTFGKWTAAAEVDLWDKPDGQRSVAHLAKGEPVEALTGDVYLRPTPVVVLEPKAEAGQLLYLLDYNGEGWSQAWRDGKVIGLDMSTFTDYCPESGESCTGEFLEPYQAGTWWVKIRTKAGVVGWTKATNSFSGSDRCG